MPQALEHLVGLQAQAPDAPYVGLWSRVAGFEPAQLACLVSGRHAVRAPLMRATVHLVTTGDAAWLRPVLQPMIERHFARSPFAKQLAGTQLDGVVAAAVGLLGDQPMTRAELGAALAARWPGQDPTALAYAATYLLPVAQVPPRGIWRAGGAARWAALGAGASTSLGCQPARGHLVQLLTRYLGAFGPATVRDAQVWCGLGGLQEIADDLGDLRRFLDDTGRELLDLPDAPRPDPATPAPPRFLPEYDNLLFSHADRARVVPDNRPVPLLPGNGGNAGTLLVDGTFQGI